MFPKAAGIDLNPLYVLNTQKAAQHPLDLEYRYTFEQLIKLLKCPFEPEILHVAGNDANLAARALLLIACVDSADLPKVDPAQQDILTALENIAREPLPLEAYHKEVQARLKLEKNRQKRAKQKRSKKRKKSAAEGNG